MPIIIIRKEKKEHEQRPSNTKLLPPPACRTRTQNIFSKYHILGNMKRHAYLNVWYLAPVLLTYIASVLLVYRSALPAPESNTKSKQHSHPQQQPHPQQQQQHSAVLGNLSFPKTKGVQVGNESSSSLSSSLVSTSASPLIDVSPGIAWLMSFGGSVRRNDKSLKSNSNGEWLLQNCVSHPFSIVVVVVVSPFFLCTDTGNIVHHYQCGSYDRNHHGHKLCIRIIG